MKNLLLTIACIVLLGTSYESKAQCNYVPTVYPDNLIMCPNTTDTLWTQVYDSYQWYKNDTIIPGATNRFIVVDQYWDGGYNFKVVTTLNGCIDTSVSVLIDGWAFSSPYVMHGGDAGWIDMDGITHLCIGDTATLTMPPFPYDTNIVWYKNGLPIEGENGFELKIFESGFYTMSASPKICPNFTVNLGLEVGFIVHEGIAPTIHATGSLLSSSNAVAYQWFFNGNIIPNAVQQSYRATASGNYTVLVIDTNLCEAESKPFSFILSGIANEKLNSFAFYPNPSTDKIKIDLPESSSVYDLIISDVQGKIMKSVKVSSENNVVQIDELNNGVYLLELSNSKEKYSNKLSVLK